MITSKQVLQADGAPVRVELTEGPSHPTVPLTVYAFSTPVTPEFIEAERARVERKVEAMAELHDQEVPEELNALLDTITEALGKANGVGLGEPFELCWN